MKSHLQATVRQIARRFLVMVLVLATTLSSMNGIAHARFISPDDWDPTLPGVGTNRYAYAHNDPINKSDPNGHAPMGFNPNVSYPDFSVDDLQLGLDGAGFAPVLGPAFDVANATISALRGDYIGAGLSVFGAIPGIGDAFTATKLVNKLDDVVSIEGKATKALKPGDTGTYRELKAHKKAYGETEPLDLDHQPSFAAQVKNTEDMLGRKLTRQERAALKMDTPVVASPRDIHRKYSPTYGGRNSKGRVAEDVKDLGAAGARDRKAFDAALERRDQK